MNYLLRPFTSQDITDLATFANNENIAKFMTNQFPHPYTKEKAELFINLTKSQNPPTILAIEVNGAVSGGIGLHIQQDIYSKNAELGYWLAEIYWGKGIMTKAISEMIIYGFKNFDINRIFARPFGTNFASQKVLEKAGFVIEAHLHETFFKNGKYEDELIYAKRRTQS